ncbi:MazG nucleotide pyrophosphohydrolase domain-containing protein [Thiolapillus sp.]|uniref:MazG nucleotide pyrophosphohydrolase domain-containing protein n=1 Tax=Thiolapillus sp. TaxID=2017437 RepID=UPI0025F23949|nr:MazG nucleotide pyrophosphohydrolase domain-containing protein [Thiolapillus sp.]
MNIFNETNELAEKISSLLNKEGIEEELGAVLVYVLEEADSHLMTYLEDQADT